MQKAPPGSSLFHYGWVIVAAGMFCILACLGFGRFALGMLLPSMAATLDLSYSQMGFIGTANFLGYLVSVLFCGHLAVRVGSRVVDLDGGKLGNAPFGPWARARGLARLERSYVKRFGAAGPLGPDGGSRFWEMYPAGDSALRLEVLRFRWTGRLEVFWHRMGWRLLGGARREDGP